VLDTGVHVHGWSADQARSFFIEQTAAEDRCVRKSSVRPPGDVGAERGLSALLQLEPGLALRRGIERFGRFRGYLYFFGLGESLLRKNLIHAAPNKRVAGVSLTAR
jgi:hypothetical protein